MKTIEQQNNERRIEIVDSIANSPASLHSKARHIGRLTGGNGYEMVDWLAADEGEAPQGSKW